MENELEVIRNSIEFDRQYQKKIYNIPYKIKSFFLGAKLTGWYQPIFEDVATDLLGGRLYSIKLQLRSTHSPNTVASSDTDSLGWRFRAFMQDHVLDIRYEYWSKFYPNHIQ